jgi:hypothetical protein
MLKWLTSLFKKLNIKFSWAKTNCKNQKQKINGDSNIAINGDNNNVKQHYYNHNFNKSKQELLLEIVNIPIHDWEKTDEGVFRPKSNTNIVMLINDLPGNTWANHPFLKEKINPDTNNPNVWAEKIKLQHNGQTLHPSFIGLWLDGGRVMIPYPKPIDNGNLYVIEDFLTLYLSKVRSRFVDGNERVKYWLNKLGIKVICDLSDYFPEKDKQINFNYAKIIAANFPENSLRFFNIDRIDEATNKRWRIYYEPDYTNEIKYRCLCEKQILMKKIWP